MDKGRKQAGRWAALAAVVAAAVAAALVGCGGGDGGASSLGAGALGVTFRFPAAQAAVPAAIPRATNSFRLSVVDPDTRVPLVPDTVVARSAGDSQTVRLTDVRIGQVELRVRAYGSADGTGDPIAAATTTAKVETGGYTPVTIVLGLLPHHLGVAPETLRLEKGLQAGLTATMYDADGGVLLGSYTFTWDPGDDTVAAVGTSGQVTGTGVGETDVTVTETGTGKQATCHVVVWQRTPTFAVIRGTHYRGSEDDAYFRAALRAIAAEPDVTFILGLGDLTADGTVAELQGLKALLDEAGLPYHLVKGDFDNHTNGANYESVFGSSNVIFTSNGVTFMGVDDTAGNGATTNPVILQSSLDWVSAHLPAATDPLIVFTHFPLMDAGVPNDQTVWSKRSRPQNAEALLSLFDGCSLAGVLCDHWRADVRDTTTRPGTTLYTGWCLCSWKANHDGDPRKGYYLCGYADGALSARFHEFVFSGS
jgi:hypothetical protein